MQSNIIKADCKHHADYNPDVSIDELPLVEEYLKFVKKVF